MSTCKAVRHDCADCRRWSRCDGDCDDLCQLQAEDIDSDEWHDAWHRAHYCAECGTDKHDAEGKPREEIQLCSAGRCENFHCPDCGEWWGSDGPMLCPCSTSRWTRFTTWLYCGWLWLRYPRRSR